MDSSRSSTQSWAHYAHLILYKTYAELKAESERTYVGYAWWVIDPLLSMAVYWAVFAWFLQRGTDDYPSFLLVGLVPWRWLSAGLSHGAGSILVARSLMQQVYVPKIILPIVSVLTDTVKFLMVLVLLLVYVLAAGYGFGWHLLALPLIVLVQGTLVCGLALVVAGATPFAPDVRIVLENIVRLWLFLSGVFYPLEVLPQELRSVFLLNPMATIIEAYRDVLLGARWPAFGQLLAVWGAAAAIACLGAAIIRRHDYAYPKIVS